jgi:hypothetical protein
MRTRSRRARTLAAVGALAIAGGALAGSASAASAPRAGSKWSAALKGQRYESGTVSLSVVKQGGKLYAKGRATLHTACFALEAGQSLRVGPTRTLSFSGRVTGSTFVARKGTTDDLLHWELQGSFAKGKLVVSYAEETEGPPRISCGFNETASGKLTAKRG